MATLNSSGTVFSSERLAGGEGQLAAKNSDEQSFRRSVLACMLWEDLAYESGSSVAKNICGLVPKLDPALCSSIASEARNDQKIRHVPLLIAREMCRYDTHKKYVCDLLYDVIQRPDELTEFLAIYWKDGKEPLAAQAKKGLAQAFTKFDEYALAKYNRKKEIKLKDVLKLVHPKPLNDEQSKLFKKLLDDSLATPDTWEVGLSAATTDTQKRRVWAQLIDEKKLGALATLRNLNNMQKVSLPSTLIRQALSQVSPARLMPIDFIKAADYAPSYTKELTELMNKCMEKWPKLPGTTIFVLDASGSMRWSTAGRSKYNRMDAGVAMAMMAESVCEHSKIYLTAGSGNAHKTAQVPSGLGLGLPHAIKVAKGPLGGGGIFTAQCLDYIRTKETEDPDRIIVFSDSQDCDYRNRVPKPFGNRNYIVDISSHKNGVNYSGVWDQEITGYSEHFLKYILEIEKIQ